MSNALPAPDRPCPGAALYLADCRDVLPLLPPGSFDLVFTDPPYPCIDRSYGTWTEAGWWGMMRAVVPECMRLLKPTGSAVFVLQPNSERVGRMRTWLWDFMAWVGREWGVVQDAYWWNHVAVPLTKNDPSLLRASVKHCVWVGPSCCHRAGENVQWREAEASRQRRVADAASGRCLDSLTCSPGGITSREGRKRGAAERQGGVTAFNLIPLGVDGKAGGLEHPARTPGGLCSWWVRYLCPPGGAVLDPFSGTGTTGLAAVLHGCDYTGVERIPEYHATARRRLAEAAGPLFATPPAADAGG